MVKAKIIQLAHQATSTAGSSRKGAGYHILFFRNRRKTKRSKRSRSRSKSKLVQIPRYILICNNPSIVYVYFSQSDIQRQWTAFHLKGKYFAPILILEVKQLVISLSLGFILTLCFSGTAITTEKQPIHAWVPLAVHPKCCESVFLYYSMFLCFKVVNLYICMCVW